MTNYKFQGSKYDDNLGIKEIAQLVRKDLKAKYPKCKFSVTIKRYAGGQSMNVSLTESDFNPFNTPDENLIPLSKISGYNTVKDVMESWKKTIDNGHHGINEYYINDDFILSEKGKEVSKDIREIVSAYNFDDSDSMSDYFHVNFYSHLSIGSWVKPLKINL